MPTPRRVDLPPPRCSPTWTLLVGQARSDPATSYLGSALPVSPMLGPVFMAGYLAIGPLRRSVERRSLARLLLFSRQ